MADQEERLTERLMVQLSPRDLRALEAIAEDMERPLHGSPVGASGSTSPRSSKRRRRWQAVTTSSRRCAAKPASAARRMSKGTDGNDVDRSCDARWLRRILKALSAHRTPILRAPPTAPRRCRSRHDGDTEQVVRLRLLRAIQDIGEISENPYATQTFLYAKGASALDDSLMCGVRTAYFSDEDMR